jgi:hypothetical protein
MLTTFISCCKILKRISWLASILFDSFKFE